MRSRLRPMAYLSVACIGLGGCGLTPVPLPPTATSNPSGIATSYTPKIPTADPVAPTGFTAYEQAALRVRNINIECGGVSSGSGFAIADHVFVTNRHVIGGAAVLQVSTYDGHDIEVATSGAVVIADLALVWTEDPLPATISLAPRNPVVGTNVTAVGFPLGGPLTTTNGKVLAYGPDPVGKSDIPMLMNDAPIEHGSSGSPLINDQGQLVGVAYAGVDNVYAAVPVDVLRQVLTSPSDYSYSATCDGVL